MGIISAAIEKLRKMLTKNGGSSGGGGGSAVADLDPVWVRVGVLNNPQVATYASYLERGWVQTVTPRQAGWLNANGLTGVRPGARLVLVPRPFIEAAIQNNEDKWRKMASNMIRRQSPNLDLRQVAAFLGARAAEALREQIATANGMERRKASTLEIYAFDYAAHHPNGRPRGSSVNNTETDKPLVRTGRLLGSISFTLGDDEG